ncbi:uncharacterized protein V6R79_011462 [Siganus canaliculatus]
MSPTGITPARADDDLPVLHPGSERDFHGLRASESAAESTSVQPPDQNLSDNTGGAAQVEVMDLWMELRLQKHKSQRRCSGSSCLRQQTGNGGKV